MSGIFDLLKMATGGEVQGQKPAKTGSEDLDQLKCQPCLEDGNVYDAAGMCVDCEDYLCQKCFQIHTLPKPCRNHQLIDKEQMLHRQISASPVDECTEKCTEHEDEIINHYCTKHCQLGCTVCIKNGHTSCKTVHYIPDVAKDLANNIEYRQAERRLKAALGTFETATENCERNCEQLEASCAEAVKSIKEFRKSIDEVLNKMETELIETVQAIKSKEMEELAEVTMKVRAAQEELQKELMKMEDLKKSKQSCILYINMMRTMATLTTLDSQITGAGRDATNKNSLIRFSPNPEILKMLKQSHTFGVLSTSESARGRIVQAKYEKSIDSYGFYMGAYTQIPFCISGLVVLPDNKLALADNGNTYLKVLSLDDGRMLTQLKVSSGPWDLTYIGSNKVAVTLPEGRKIIIVTMTDNTMIIDRTLIVRGQCRGIDYRNDTLAVSYCEPHKVQVLSMQGSVLHDISASTLNFPYYLIYGNDDTKLYVSNYQSNNVVCIKLDGTVVATYTDSELLRPQQLVMDRMGDICVCAKESNMVHQITEDCKIIRVLLCKGDVQQNPYSICLDAEKDKLYVGFSSKWIKVYNLATEPL